MDVEDTDDRQILAVRGDEVFDGDDSGLGGGVREASGSYNYDLCLTSLHTYLGDVDDTRGRHSLLDGGTVLNLPMFYVEGVVLFPEATLPLKVLHPRFIAAIHKALNNVDAPCIIGVVRVFWLPDDGKTHLAYTGTTAEIRQYRRQDDGSLNVVARGQQRFRLRHHWIDVEGATCGEVEIVQEDVPLRTPNDAFGRLACVTYGHRKVATFSSAKQNNDKGNTNSKREQVLEGSVHCNKKDEVLAVNKHAVKPIIGSSQGKGLDDTKEVKNNLFGHRPKIFHAPMSFWPRWVYDMYDSYSLAEKAEELWRQIVGNPSMNEYVRKPDLLSFYIASKLPMSEATRQELLEIDGVSYRLRREIELLRTFNHIRCRTCESFIAKRSDMVVMSSDGPLNAYANPHGIIHEIITVHNATGLALSGPPVEEYSWFPGYAWTIANCASCGANMGWLFTTTKKNLLPKWFWGIRSCQVEDDTQN